MGIAPFPGTNDKRLTLHLPAGLEGHMTAHGSGVTAGGGPPLAALVLWFYPPLSILYKFDPLESFTT